MGRAFALGRGRLSVGKVLCVARNDVDHAREMGTSVPDRPISFWKPATSLLVGGGEILLPPESRRVEVATELAAILGRPGRDVPESDAMNHIGGYAVFFDITARDLQAAARRKVPLGPPARASTPSPPYRNPFPQASWTIHTASRSVSG
jgi:2-keto-4-pentenoate hydratase/2-oxohepta-3-ene-1,7-dioic acid hydratase in catechol pathway